MLTCRLAYVGCRYDISLEVLYKLQTLRWDWLVGKVGIWICLQKFLCMLLSQSYQWRKIWCAIVGKNVRKWDELITRGLWFCYHVFIKFYFPKSKFIFQTEKERGHCPVVPCWTSALGLNCLLPAVPSPPPHLPAQEVSYHIQPWPHPISCSANKSTTGETGEPMAEELAIVNPDDPVSCGPDSISVLITSFHEFPFWEENHQLCVDVTYLPRLLPENVNCQLQSYCSGCRNLDNDDKWDIVMCWIIFCGSPAPDVLPANSFFSGSGEPGCASLSSAHAHFSSTCIGSYLFWCEHKLSFWRKLSFWLEYEFAARFRR